MPQNPPPVSGHRRAQSVIFPDSINFDIDDHMVPSDTKEDPVSKYLTLDEDNLSNENTTAFQVGESFSQQLPHPYHQHQNQ